MAGAKKDVKKHISVHTLDECFCPHCGETFGRLCSLTRHIDVTPKCRTVLGKYQYEYHNAIFSLFYLGLFDTFDVCETIFIEKAKRKRLPLPDASKFQFAKFHIEWDVGNDDEE